MVVFCKRCGTPVKLDNARLADPAYSVKCQQCQRPVAIDTVRPASTGAAHGTAGGAATAVESAAAHATEVNAVERTHYLQKVHSSADCPTKNAC